MKNQVASFGHYALEYAIWHGIILALRNQTNQMSLLFLLLLLAMLTLLASLFQKN